MRGRQRLQSPGIVKILLSAAVIALGAASASAGGFSAERPYAGAFGSPEADAPFGSILDKGQVLAPSINLFKDSTVIDFEKRQVTLIRYDPMGFVIRTHYYGELNEYLMERARAALTDVWLGSSMLSKSASGQEKQKGLKLAWELPVQYPSWAQRVLGNEPPRLSINGSMRIKMAYEDVRRKESNVLDQAQSAGPGFNFEPQYQFSVAGSVGRLINVNISANSESDVDVNDPLKNFHIDYKASKEGELEDEIVQEVIAGYTGFSMPGTQLSGYSESHEGLFGIKITSRLGPVTLTTIASNEQGESQKLSVSNAGTGGAGGTTLKKDDAFRANKRFFLDTAYIRHYNRKYAINGGNSKYSLPDTLGVTGLQVWKKIVMNNEEASIRQGDISRKVREFYIDPTKQAKYNFQRLEPERHYWLYPKEGWIRFADSVSIIEGQDMIAIFLRTGTSTISRGGDTTDPADSGNPSWLWVLKPDQYIDSLGADPERFRLMWRNVYEIPNEVPDISKFMLRLYHTGKDGGDTCKKNKKDVFLSDVIGLTKNAVPLTGGSDIFNFENREIIIPPYDTGAYGNEPFANPELTNSNDDDLRDTLIYRYGPNSKALSVSASSEPYKPLFTMEMSGASKKTTFDLGFGVMEKTVQVTADGRQLQANVDYVLNTEIGRLELVSPSAKAADRIEINYQREALFMPERKLFLGMRAEMKLPFISEKSLAGLSVLWQKTAVSQDIPRINQEPYSKLLLDFNTRLDFQPAWMTALVNRLPFVSTEAQSTATVDVEVAHSRMNPNTDREAFVDDFESSKQVYSLGESYRNWFRASPPLAKDSLVSRPPAWDWYWFTPVYSDQANGVLRTQMWSDTERVNTGMAKYEPVLRLHCKPAPEAPSLRDRFNRSWAGIMTPIPVNLADRKRDQYFEMLLKCPQGPAGRGRLLLQMGRMREDICVNGFPPNGRPDKEDTSRIWRENHDPNLDLGLDGKTDENEWYAVPDSTIPGGWDTTLVKGDTRLGEWANDPARDNYSKEQYDEQHPENFRKACRYEKDGWANETEDIDNNGTVEYGAPEYYHEFIIDLSDTNSPYIDRSARLVRDTAGEPGHPGCSWRRYRIPLHEIIPGFTGLRRDTGVAPDDWHDIRMVRLVWEGFDSAHLTQESQLILNGLQFVGSQWEAIRDSAGRTKIDVSAIGTREDVVYAAEVIEAENMRLIKRNPDETNVKQPEQSMRLNFHNLRPGEEAVAQRTFSYQPLNVSSYDSLTLVLYGRDTTEPGYLNALDMNDVKFVFRFGSDTSTYYEYRRTIRHRWDNYVCVNLRQLSDLKLAWQTAHTAGEAIDTMNADSSLHIKAPKGRQPNFSNIVWMAVGVECAGNSTADSVAGELWVDELKVVGIKQFNGWASRLSLQTQWADFLSLSAGLNYESGDFRTMTDNKITMGDSKLSGSLNLSTGIDKFLPREWGFSIPVGGSITTSLSRPQLKPNTDIYLTDRETGKPDGFLKMVKDAVGLSSGSVTEAERFETKSYSQNFFVNFSKSKTSTNPAVDMLLQRLSTSFQYSKSSSHTNRGQRAGSDTMYVDSSLTTTYSGGVNYNLSPQDPPRWTKWKPLDKSTAAWLPSRWKDLEFSLLPAKIELNLASANYSTREERRFNLEADMPLSASRDFTLKHGVQLDFSPIRPILDFSYSLNVDRRFPNDSALGGGGGALRFLGQRMFALDTNRKWRDYSILRNEISRSQNFKATLNPQIFDWLTNSAEYKADYSGKVTEKQNDPQKFINSAVNSGLSFSSSLSVDQLLRKAGDSSWLGKLTGRIKKGCDAVGFSSVSFNYSSAANLNNQFLGAGYLDSLDVGWAGFMAYQLGLNGSNIITGDLDDNEALGGMRNRSRNDDYNYYKDDNRAANRNFQIQTGLRFAAPFELSLSPISLQWSTRYTVRPDTTYYDTTRSFPEFRIGAQSPVLNKVKPISRHVQGIGLSSNFAVKRNTTKNFASGATTTGTVYEMSPLVSVNGTIRKWPVTFNYQHSLSKDRREAGGDTTMTTRDGDNLDLNYEIQKTAGASTIKLFKWQVPVRGRTSMGMRFSRDHSTTTTKKSTTSDVSNLSLTPHLSYIFTDNVTGTMEYLYSKVTNNGSTTTMNTASLIAEIKF
jgi:hypothetical protein